MVIVVQISYLRAGDTSVSGLARSAIVTLYISEIDFRPQQKTTAATRKIFTEEWQQK